MDYIKELINVGDDVLHTVTSAIEENDFSGLSSELKERFRIFEEDVREDLHVRTGGAIPRSSRRPGGSSYSGGRAPRRVTREVPSDQQEEPADRRRTPPFRQNVPPWQREAPPYYQPGQYAGPGNQRLSAAGVPYRQNPRKIRTPFRPRFFGKGGAIAKMTAGIIGMVGLIPAEIVALANILFGGMVDAPIVFLSLLPFTAGSVWLTVTGNKRRKLVDVYNRFAQIVGPAEYISMEELATGAGTSEEDAVRSIEQLMKNKMLPQGRLDRKKTTLMLTPKVWKQYLELERHQQQKVLEKDQSTVLEEAAPDYGEEDTVLREGRDFISQVRSYNDRIQDEEMSERLFHLEEIVQKIFLQVEKDPACAPDLHKLMDYYLPTIDKLLQAYIDLDAHPAGSETIDSTRREIEDAVDTVNVAFENLFNDLFQDTAWDISTDISVMKNMMKQDGLMGDPLSQQKESV